MEFQPVRAEDKPVIDRYFRKEDSRHCDMSFASVYLWKCFYPVSYAICHDALIFKGERYQSFTFPIGADDPAPAVKEIIAFCESESLPPAFHCLSRKQAAYLEEMYPGLLTFVFDRDDAQYIYEAEKLKELRGKKYHGKKNHVNKFKRTHDWSYEEINDDNREECIRMLADWKAGSEEHGDEDASDEVCVCRKALMEREKLGLTGGLLRADGRVVAFTLGEKINSDTLVIHFEKAYADVPGAYSTINQEFLLHNAGDDIRYVNREEDMGNPGLRMAKESYHPVFMEESGYAVCDS